MNKSQWEPRVITQNLNEYEQDVDFSVPFNDGVEECLKKHTNRVEVYRVKLSPSMRKAVVDLHFESLLQDIYK